MIIHVFTKLKLLTILLAITLTIVGCEPRREIIVDALASPAKFFPSKGERVMISYSLSAESKVSVIILDLNDRVTKFIVDREIQSIGSYSYTWEGDDDSEERVEAGIYYYEILADEVRMRGRLSVN